MKATKKHKEISDRLSKVSGLTIVATPIKRNILSIEVQDTSDLYTSKFVATLERVCKQYNIGTIASGDTRRSLSSSNFPEPEQPTGKEATWQFHRRHPHHQ